MKVLRRALLACVTAALTTVATVASAQPSSVRLFALTDVAVESIGNVGAGGSHPAAGAPQNAFAAGIKHVY